MEITEIKYELLLKHLFQRTEQHGGSTIALGNGELCLKKWLPVITWNKKHSSTQVVPIAYTLGKKFGAIALS